MFSRPPTPIFDILQHRYKELWMEQQRALTVAQRVEIKKVIILQHGTATRQKLPLSHPTTERLLPLGKPSSLTTGKLVTQSPAASQPRWAQLQPEHILRGDAVGVSTSCAYCNMCVWECSGDKKEGLVGWVIFKYFSLWRYIQELSKLLQVLWPRPFKGLNTLSHRDTFLTITKHLSAPISLWSWLNSWFHLKQRLWLSLHHHNTKNPFCNKELHFKLSGIYVILMAGALQTVLWTASAPLRLPVTMDKTTEQPTSIGSC